MFFPPTAWSREGAGSVNLPSNSEGAQCAPVPCCRTGGLGDLLGEERKGRAFGQRDSRSQGPGFKAQGGQSGQQVVPHGILKGLTAGRFTGRRRRRLEKKVVASWILFMWVAENSELGPLM